VKKRFRVVVAGFLLPVMLNMACSRSSDPNVVVSQGEEGGGGGEGEWPAPVLRATFDSCMGPVEFSGDGKSLAVVGAGANGPMVQLIDVAANKVRSTLAKKARLYATAIAFSRDDKALATAWEEEVIFWDVATGERKQAFKAWAPDLGMVNHLAFSPDGTLLAAIGRNFQMTGEVKIWEVASGKEIATLPEDPNVVHDGLFSADGKRLATVGFDKNLGPTQSKTRATIKIWDVAQKNVLEKFKEPPDELTAPSSGAPAMQIRFGDNGNLQVLGRRGETMKLWDVATGNAISTFKGQAGRIIAAAFSRDGKLLAAGDQDGGVTIWDVASGNEVTRFQAIQRWAGTIAFNNDSTLLATAGGTNPPDMKLTVWTLPAK